eukprot:CAMPEP_0197419798 /NCGR_PEP_ID=MMETSP1170-20131217/5313_1 /TAXON_ID=54406 /ORGANISM="Sarcinochrysis sp, Strain CCMP770" /LENGTH=236 /DNA_ID=CAMNT_0042946913 /DNA_START=12 /DNA_END=722 /DNA_ORIENTATION=+
MLAGARMILDTVDARPEYELYQVALSNMEGGGFDLVLVFELWQESITQLAALLGLALPLRYTIKQEFFAGAPLHKPHLDGQLHDLVRRFNSFDAKLHARATDIIIQNAHDRGREPAKKAYDCARRLVENHAEFSDCTLKDHLRDRDLELERNRTSSFRDCKRRMAIKAAKHEHLASGAHHTWRRQRPSFARPPARDDASPGRRAFCKRPGLMCAVDSERCWRSQACDSFRAPERGR